MEILGSGSWVDNAHVDVDILAINEWVVCQLNESVSVVPFEETIL